MGTTMLFAVFFVVSYLLQDVLYGMIDPRIRVAGHRE
jgi:oligopeptide transport system permease protein